MKVNTRIRSIGLITLSLSIISCTSNGTQQSKVLSPPTAANTAANAMAIVEPSIIGPPMRAKGQNASLTLFEDLERTMVGSDPAMVWLESDKSGKPSRYEFSSEVIGHLNDEWRRLTAYRYAKDFSGDPNRIAETTYAHTIEAVRLLNILRTIQVDRDGKMTRLKESEVNEIVDVQTELFRQRYGEILDSFPDAASLRK